MTPTPSQNEWRQGRVDLFGNVVLQIFNSPDPTDYYKYHKPGRDFHSGEERLMYATLMDALADVREIKQMDRQGRRKAPKEGIRAVEAMLWILEDNKKWPFSFVNLCDWFALNVERVRKKAVEAYQKRFGYEPTEAILSSNREWLMVNHSFIRADHCLKCRQKNKARQYQDSNPIIRLRKGAVEAIP